MRRAFLMGSNGPKNGQQLKYAVQDANSLKSILEQSFCGYETIMPEPGIDCFDADKLLTKIAASCSPEDTFICYFSGHGINDKGEFFLALDDTTEKDYFSTALSMKRVSDILRHCKAKSKLLILDCCHAGLFEDYLGAKSKTCISVEEVIVTPDNYLALMASKRLEKTRELETLNGSFLTVNLRKALSSQYRDADIDRDNKISIHDLKKWLEIKYQEHNTSYPEHRVPCPYLFGRYTGEMYIAEKNEILAEIANASEILLVEYLKLRSSVMSGFIEYLEKNSIIAKMILTGEQNISADYDFYKLGMTAGVYSDQIRQESKNRLNQYINISLEFYKSLGIGKIRDDRLLSGAYYLAKSLDEILPDSILADFKEPSGAPKPKAIDYLNALSKAGPGSFAGITIGSAIPGIGNAVGLFSGLFVGLGVGLRDLNLESVKLRVEHAKRYFHSLLLQKCYLYIICMEISIHMDLLTAIGLLKETGVYLDKPFEKLEKDLEIGIKIHREKVNQDKNTNEPDFSSTSAMFRTHETYEIVTKFVNDYYSGII